MSLFGRRERREIAELTDYINRLRSQRDKAVKERETAVFNRRQINDQYTDVCIVNTCLTEDLAAARDRLAEHSGRRTVGDVLEEHDVHRKALAAAIDAGLDRNWEQLVEAAAGVYKAAGEWMADHKAEKHRADALQTRLDYALGLKSAAVEAGSGWRDRRGQRMKYDKPTAEEAS